MVLINTNDGRVGVLTNSRFDPFVTNAPTFTDIAKSSTGKLYGVNFQSLYKINRSSGTVTYIGSLGVSNINALAFGPNNRLYAAGDSNFYRINLNTGKAQLIATISDFYSSGDIVYDRTRKQFFATSSTFGKDFLYSIKLGGKATEIGNIRFRDVFALAFKGKTLTGYTDARQEIAISIKTGKGTFKRRIRISGEIWGAT
jgi:hypothetical protein